MGDSASKGLVGFLRGLLTNLGTPPATSVIRSILVRPRMDRTERPRPNARATLIMNLTSVRSRGFAPPSQGRTASAAAQGAVDVAPGVPRLEGIALVVEFAA